MYGVSKISIEPSLMMISVQDVEFKGNSLARYLQIFADTDRKSTRLNSSHVKRSRMPSSA